MLLLQLSRLTFSRRMLISQDKDEVWITLAEFDASYVEYICNGTIPKGDKGFLEMQELGPFPTENRKYMDYLAKYILAFVLEECDWIK